MPGPARFAILGTAGHIDHGKTALVGLLTGTDTDRLQEEKLRGISIDLGFARLDLPDGTRCGVVDVPGHERFVKNMLAGACGVDAMLLVVAADEGVMPQTREHLDILRLLGVERGIVALTKIDLVDDDLRELARDSVEEALAARGLAGFTIVPVSSRTGEGKEQVLAALAAVLAGLDTKPAGGPPRLPIDRAFVKEGFGTVVTGTLWQGTLRVGDRLSVEPGGRETRVRNLEVHGVQVAEARAGQRTAVALAGVSREQVPRGHWLLGAGMLRPSHMLDVRLRVLPEAVKEIRHRQRVRFHLGASEILGRVALLEGETLPPGKEGLAQLRLETPAVAARGDRFVVRFYSPARTVAGGTVILPDAPKRRRGHARALEEVRREESGSLDERLVAALEMRDAGGTPAEVCRDVGLEEAVAAEALARLSGEGKIRRLADGRYLSLRALERLGGRAEALLAGLQEEHPLRWGMSKGELGSRLARKLPGSVLDEVILELRGSGRVSEEADHLRWGSAEHELPPDLAARVARVAAALEGGELTPPNLKELETQLGHPPGEILEHLTFRGVAVKVSPDLFLNRLQFQRLTGWLAGFFGEHEGLTPGDLRERWGMSRKYSVPILEYLDKCGWTRRRGDIRVPGRRLTG
jgi:selenocysteine-specific elongation factor